MYIFSYRRLFFLTWNNFDLWEGVPPPLISGGGGVHDVRNPLLKTPFFSLFSWLFFQLWVPPDFFADFSQIFGTTPRFFFRFLPKNLVISNFFDKKSEKNLGFFLEISNFFDKKSVKKSVFFARNFQIF